MSIHDYSPGGRYFRWIYFLGVGVAIFSGMGQMPIFKRYYVTSIPLMQWSENYYYLSNLHYLAAILLIALMAWRLSMSKGILDRRWSWGPRTWWGWTLLAVILVSGAFKVARNYGLYINPTAFMILDFVHLGSAMAFMFTGIAALIKGRKLPTAQTT